MSKTKEMTLDFSKSPQFISPVEINDQTAEVVQQYEYIGDVIDDKLKKNFMCRLCVWKKNQHLCFYQKLQSFNEDSTLIKMFDSNFITSVLKLSCVSWYGSLTLQK